MQDKTFVVVVGEAEFIGTAIEVVEALRRKEFFDRPNSEPLEAYLERLEQMVRRTLGIQLDTSGNTLEERCMSTLHCLADNGLVKLVKGPAYA